jgi:vitamin B12 transporter
MHNIIWLAAAAAAPVAPASDAIVVTGSREPIALETAPVSVTVFEREEIEALALPMTADLLRLSPGVAVASTGPRGTQTQLRIRGAEANHSLLFVDGIRFNDPAAGNEARFELLTNDARSRVELVRGPQSALWGSEALGGVIAIETGGAPGISLSGEYGSLDSKRASARFATTSGDLALSGAAGWIASDGIDSFGGGGERDGFENRSASLKAVFAPLPSTEFGLVGHWVEGESEYDGLDPVTFKRADTLDETENRISALRAWGRHEGGGWSLMVDGSFLDSANRNRLAGAPLNTTSAQRFTLGGQLSRRIEAGGGVHRLTAAVEHEAEDFRARDTSFGGGTDQDRSRELTAAIGEWRAEWTPRLATDLSVRHDRFSAFEDATSLRASLLFRPAPAWTLHAAYGEGIAQPTFFDLFGFFPGSFVGNPGLKPESSRGIEAGVRWSDAKASLGVTAFAHRLEDEIVETFDGATFLSSTANASGKSKRRGVEVSGEYRFGAVALAANYTFLDADERRVAGAASVKELRRPRHTANLIATGRWGALEAGGSLAYVGARRDTDFDFFPGRPVKLGDYLLGSLNLAYRLSPLFEVYARAENALGADYQDVIGYETAGRTVYAGLRVALGR